MRISLLALAGLGLTAGGFLAGAWAQGSPDWPWPAALDAVSAAPKNHKVLYEDDKVRILEVDLGPGQTEEVHFHRWSTVFMVDSPGAFTYVWKCDRPGVCGDGKSFQRPRPPPGTPLPIVTRLGPVGPHYTTNTDTIPTHGYRVEFKHLAFGP